jgi:hypothetical protein
MPPAVPNARSSTRNRSYRGEGGHDRGRQMAGLGVVRVGAFRPHRLDLADRRHIRQLPLPGWQLIDRALVTSSGVA